MVSFFLVRRVEQRRFLLRITRLRPIILSPNRSNTVEANILDRPNPPFPTSYVIHSLISLPPLPVQRTPGCVPSPMLQTQKRIRPATSSYAELRATLIITRTGHPPLLRMYALEKTLHIMVFQVFCALSSRFHQFVFTFAQSTKNLDLRSLLMLLDIFQSPHILPLPDPPEWPMVAHDGVTDQYHAPTMYYKTQSSSTLFPDAQALKRTRMFQ